nr:transposase (putative), gypsy type [Tanacetum cinerariifolium]
MRPLALRHARRPRSDHGKARHSVSSTSAHYNCGSLSRQEYDDEDYGASRASTPSPTTYLNSLKPLNYQQYEIPSPSEQSDDLLFERQTELLNQSQGIHKEDRGGFKSFGKLKGQIEEFQDVQMNIVNDKVAKLDADLLEMALHQEKKFYPHLLTTISGRRWLLTHGLKLAVIKCLNSHEYLSPLEAAIIRSIEKGMQDGLSADIDRGKACRKLADVIAYNLSVEANYNFTRECCSEVSALIDVWTPLVDLLFVKNLMAEADTSDSMPTTTAITTALSTTFASASFVPLITIEYCEIMGTDGPEDSQ